MTAKNVNSNSEKLYMRYDLQDESDFEIETLQGMRDWLADFWESNPDEGMDEEDVEKLVEEIMNSDEGEIFERLAGIDYSYYELDENGEIIPDEYIEQVKTIEQNLATGYGVRLEELDEKTLQVTVTRAGEKNIYTTELPETEEEWNEIFEKEREKISKEARVVREREMCECDNEDSYYVQEYGVCICCYQRHQQNN